jgi:uncharacterized protein DUF6894
LQVEERIVTLYSLHLRDGTEKFVDANPREYASLDRLRSAMLAAAREALARDAGEGNLDFRFRIDAEDATGAIVCSVRLEHVCAERSVAAAD